MFKKGQKLVCIDPIDELKMGQIVTYNTQSGDLCYFDDFDGGYYNDRFIPLLTKEDIKVGDKLRVEYVPEIGEEFNNAEIYYHSGMDLKVQRHTIINVDEIIDNSGLNCGVWDNTIRYTVPLMYCTKIQNLSEEFIEIPRSAFKEIYSLLCNEYEDKVNEILGRDLMSENVKVYKEEILSAYSDSKTSKHEKTLTEWLEVYCPKPKKLVKKQLVGYANVYNHEDITKSVLHKDIDSCLRNAAQCALAKGVKITIEYEVEE